ncbi:MAG: PAS domain-containing protein [Alphaproteobacteria bacterium]
MDINTALLRAIQSTSEGVTLTDPNQQDNPLVYVNDAFCRMTGHNREDVLGRNCRFLQGAATDADTVQRIAQCIREARIETFEIYNYKKNGTGFWNRLALVPLVEHNRLMYFAGIQADITQHKEAFGGIDAHRQGLSRMIDLASGGMIDTINEIEKRCNEPAFVQKSCRKLMSQTSLMITMLQHNSTEILDYVKTARDTVN